MQIHELTKGPRKPKATNEGLLNTLKSAVSAAKTGYQAGKGATGSTLGGAGTALGTFGRAVTDGGFGAQADWDANAKAGMDKYNALKKKYGWTDKNDEKAAAAASTAGQPDIAKAAQDLTAEFQATDLFKDITGAAGAPGQQTQADPATVAQQDSQTPFVEPGKQLTVPPEVSGYPGSYTVDATGAWRSEDNKRITDQATIAKLNTFANQGQDSGKIKPKAVATPQPQGKGKGGAAALNKAATAAAATAPQAKQPAQPGSPMAEAASNARKARRAAAGITKPTAQAAPTKPAAQPAQTQAPAAQTQQPTAQPAQAQAPAADPSIVQKIEQDPKLKPMFDKFGKEFGVTPDEVKSRPEVKQALAGLLKVINSKAPAGKDQRVAKAFQSYATVVLTAMKAEGTGEDADGDGVPDNQAAGQDQQASSATNPVIQQAATNKLVAQGLDKTTIEKVKQVAQKDPTPVKQALGLQERLHLELKRLKLNEDQVRITKDIIVPTNAGNYVKKASDQQWYAPNGVMIDSEKYAEYIKKLDATPQAQTRYQADQAGPGGGSDTSFKKAQQAPQQQAPQQPAKSPVNTNPPPATNPPPPGTPQPDPMAEMLKQQQIQQFLRNRDVSIINGLVKDTTEQLRNAEIFNTGQQDYLKQQLAQMIALKV